MLCSYLDLPIGSGDVALVGRKELWERDWKCSRACAEVHSPWRHHPQMHSISRTSDWCQRETNRQRTTHHSRYGVVVGILRFLLLTLWDLPNWAVYFKPQQSEQSISQIMWIFVWAFYTWFISNKNVFRDSVVCMSLRWQSVLMVLAKMPHATLLHMWPGHSAKWLLIRHFCETGHIMGWVKKALFK